VILNLAVAAGGRPAIRRPTRLPLQILRAKQVGLLVAAFVALLATKSHAAEVIPPKPDRYFNDYAGVISKSAALRFNEELARFERETSDQVVVAIFPKMQSESDIADYTQRVAQAWGVGQKERRNGVVLFVFVQDRKMFIQVGYGLEGALPDITASISPNTRSSHIFATAITKAGSRSESIQSSRRFAASTRDRERLLRRGIVAAALQASCFSLFFSSH
jgi:Beta-propeller domains of methanol dehydrogenase type